MSVSSLGSLCLRLSRRSWRSRAMMAAMEKSVAQGRAEHSSSIAEPCRSRPSPCSSIKLSASECPEPPRPPDHALSPSEHPIDDAGHILRTFEFNQLSADRKHLLILQSQLYLAYLKFYRVQNEVKVYRDLKQSQAEFIKAQNDGAYGD